MAPTVPNNPCICDGSEGLAFDSTGNLFEADARSGNIYRFTPGGARSTFASGLTFPYGLVFNSAGNLFTADTSGNIYQFTPQGLRSTFVSGLPGSGKEFGYYGLAFDRTGDLFVSDQDSGQIFKITPGGSRSTFASGLNNLTGLAFDSAGNMFVSQGSPTYPNGSGTITKFTTNGGSLVFASSDLGNLPYRLTFGAVCHTGRRTRRRTENGRQRNLRVLQTRDRIGGAKEVKITW